MANFRHIVSAIDAHTAGEPARIILSGLPLIPGATMAEKKRYMKGRLDHFRTLLMQEPRGHRDMFGVILTPTTSPHARYGALFIDCAGYLDMCGHGLMAATTALIETGMVPAAEPETSIMFDTPAGLVQCRAEIKGTQVADVSLTNVPSFLYARDVELSLPEIGKFAVDVSFGGNFFALVRAKDLGISVHTQDRSRLVQLGMAVKRAINHTLQVKHPLAGHIAMVELTEIYDKPDAGSPFSRSAVIFGNGQLDRCPCGTGTSAAMAALYARGELGLGTEFVNEGLLGNRFTGKLLREVRVGDFTAVEPIVTGAAYLTGIQQFVVDPGDPFPYGFVVGPE